MLAPRALATLRSNLVLSTAAMVLVGAVRPVLNAGVNHAFGPEWTGHAAVVVSLIFVASQLATAGLPTAAVVHVGRALGANDRDKAAGVARYAQGLLLLLAVIGALGGLAYDRLWRATPLLGRSDTALLLGGVLAYAQWRFARSVLFAGGLASKSLAVDLLSLAGAAAVLGAVVLSRRPHLAPAAYVTVYTLYSLASLPALVPMLRGGAIDLVTRRQLLAYTAFWVVSTTAANVTGDIATLVVDARVDRALVGELSVALSFLIPLGFAPRVLELPLIHELSRLEGLKDAARQRELTERATHWLGALLLLGGAGAAILARPLLALAGGVHHPDVITIFAVLSLSFSLEVLQMPASNLVTSRDHPGMQLVFGVVPFAIGAAVWVFTPGAGVLGVGAGMAIAHATKAVMFSAWVRAKHGVHVALRPIPKLLALAAALAAAELARRDVASPWLLFAAYEVLAAALFLPDLRAMALSLRGPSR